MLRQSLCCQECKAVCIGEFKKILDLQNSGLVIYQHKHKDSTVQTTSTEVLKNEYYILHNMKNSDIKRCEFIGELSQYRTKCIRCKTNIQKVRSLLDEIAAIKGKDILGKCKYCKKSNPAAKCKRCEYIVNKFLTIKTKLYEDRQNRFEQWLCTVKLFLQSILESEYDCKRNLKVSIIDLENLMNQLEAPVHEPDIKVFPDESDIMKNLIESKVMLQEIITNLKTERLGNQYLSDDSLYVSPSKTARSCICKHFLDQKTKHGTITNIHIEQKPSNIHTEVIQDPFTNKLLVEDVNLKQSIEKSITDKNALQEMTLESSKDIKNMQEIKKLKDIKDLDESKKSKQIKDLKEIKDSKDIKKQNGNVKEKKAKNYKFQENKENITPDEGKEKSPKGENSKKKGEKNETERKKRLEISSEEKLLLKLIKARENEKKKLMKANKLNKSDKLKVLPVIGKLPEIKLSSKIEVVDDFSENFIECGDQNPLYPTKMVKGHKILSINNWAEDIDSKKPLHFKVKAEFADIISTPLSPQSTPSKDVISIKRISQYENLDDEFSKGIIRYELSNREFIDKGWTKLPTKKIMRRMNIYKMSSAHPKFDWFERNKSKKVIHYSTGEILAQIEENSRGRWFYKNGVVALDYYNAQELNAGQRYVIYSSGEEYDNGHSIPITVLASFDYLGNGVVYDHYGNVRLKYNQSEGMVVDGKVAPTGRWKWHTLNDPPVLQPVFIDTFADDNNYCLEDLKDNKEENNLKKPINQDMLAIELEQFVREKANKLLQKFKPFQIRMKVLKINKQFSLRIIDQANIYVLFRDGEVSLKLNLGMLLHSDEIIDTETSEVSQVATPYDRYPPTTDSVASIQSILNKAKKVGRKRGARECPTLLPLITKRTNEEHFV